MNYAVDRLLETGWSVNDEMDLEHLPDGRAYPSVISVQREFARAGLELKDLDASFALHRVCFELASKVQSAGKILDAFRGLEVTIELYYQDKKYGQGLKASKEFLEIQEKLGVNDVLKAETYRLRLRGMILAGQADQARKDVETLLKVRKTWRNMKLKAQVEQLRLGDAVRFIGHVKARYGFSKG